MTTSLWSLNHHRLSTWRLGRQLFEFQTEFPATPCGLLVGECRGPNTDSRMPLFPHPPYSAAGRLLQYSGMSPADYLGRLERVNMCVDEWSDEEAMSRLRDVVGWLMVPSNMHEGRPLRVMLLGRRVQRTWSLISQTRFGSEVWRHDDVELQIAWAPHPSGLTRVYNAQESRDRVGKMLRWCAGLEETP